MAWYDSLNPTNSDFWTGGDWWNSNSLWNDGSGKFDYEAPEPSEEELAIYEQMGTLLEQQNEYYQNVMPLMAHQMHYNITTDSEGNTTWEKMSDDEWYNSDMTTDTERKAWDVYNSQLDRYQQALAGELPLSSTLEQQKQDEFDQLKSSIPTISGADPNTATASDTIGVQNLNEFKSRWASLEEQQRYGELTSGGAATAQAQGVASNLANNQVGGLSSLGGTYSNQLSGYSTLLQPYQAYTQAGYQAQAANQATQANMYGSVLGLAGMLGGGYLAGPLASSKDYKKNIKRKTPKDEDKALKEITKTKSYEYKYKDKMGMGGKKHIGTIAEESPDSMTTPDKKAIDIGDKMELMSMGLKSLSRKVDKLSRKVS